MIQVTFCAYDSLNVVSGPIVWLQRLLPELRNHGIESRCLFLTWGEAGTAVKRVKDMGFNTSTAICSGTTEERMKWILQQLNESPPDIFVPNLVVPAFYVARWVRDAGIPTVGILHSDDDFYRAIQDEFVFGNAQFAVSSLVCVSRELEQQVLTRRPPHSLLVRIPYGVPVPEERTQRSDTRFRLAYVGRLAEQQKRISDVARSLCLVAREISGIEAVIYGDGPDKSNVEEILATEAADLPVRLGGNISSKQVQDKLLNCDVIVLLSDYEGLPIAVLEAMACGVVPVCFQMRSGIPELVRDGITGLVVSDRNESFVSAIRRLKEDRLLFRRISSAARKRVVEQNSIQHCADQWAKHFRHEHNNVNRAKQICVPKRFQLPPVNASLAPEDPREVPISRFRRWFMYGRKFAGRVKQKMYRFRRKMNEN